MIKHVVMWKMQGDTGSAREAHAAELKRRLEALAGLIPEVHRLEVGLNVKESDAACDVVLYSEFRDADALQSYQDHPEHQAVAAYLKQVSDERHVVDYEII